MADLDAIRKALASMLSDGIPNLRAYPTFQSQINPPCAVIMPQPNQVWSLQTFEGGGVFYLRIVILVSYLEDASSQSSLDAYLSSSGSSSIWQLLRANPTLSGACEDCTITSIRGYGAGNSAYGLTEWAGQQYLASNLLLNVMAT